MAHGLVDEVWFTVSPYLWATGPRIFEDVGAVRLELVSTTTFPSGVVRLCYRPAPVRRPHCNLRGGGPRHQNGVLSTPTTALIAGGPINGSGQAALGLWRIPIPRTGE